MYSVIKSVINKYNEFLAPLDLTYTQYLVMMILWNYGDIEMKNLCERVCLDSNTLSPVVNRLIKKGYVVKNKSPQDKRIVIISATTQGKLLKEQAEPIQEKIRSLVNVSENEKMELIKMLTKIDEQLRN